MELGFGSLGQKNGASQEILKDYRTYTCNACNAALHYRHFRQKMTLNTVYKTTISLLCTTFHASMHNIQDYRQKICLK